MKTFRKNDSLPNRISKAGSGRSRLLRFLAISAVGWTASSPALCEVQLHPLFQDHLVLQRQSDSPIWGQANPGEEVKVSFRGSEMSGVAGPDGNWKVEIPTGEAGGPFDLKVSGENEIALHDILVGEVWVCAGQSNMERSISMEWDGEKEIVSTEYPQIRLFQVGQAAAREPQESMKGTWKVAEPSAVGEFSAAGFYYGRELFRALDIPIGLIQATWDGSGMYSWSPRSAIEEVWEPKHLKSVEEDLTESEAALRSYHQAFGEWMTQAEVAEKAGSPIPAPPEIPEDKRRSQDSPSRLFNGMIAPLIPYSIRGVVWHQGESDAHRAVRHTGMFPALIRGWRREWGIGDFPFYYVQLNNFMETSPEPAKSKWACFREEQLEALAEPNTGMVVTIDIGNPHDIHPKNKKEVGRRLSLIALAKIYGREIPYSGPIYRSMKAEGNKIRVEFEHTDGGLAAKGEGGLVGFAIAGQDRRYHWAKAEIEGDSVVVGNPEVPLPVSVRYGWDDNPECNLYNGANLPASPFRTDDWPDAVRDLR